MPRREIDPRQRRLAKAMRRQMTEPELIVWSRLRASALAGLAFRRQVPIGPYIVDFFCPAKALVIENIDGVGDRILEATGS